MDTTTEASLQDRYEALRAYWMTIVQASRAIGVTHTELNSPGVLISGKGAKFGNLRVPVKLGATVVAEVTSAQGSALDDFAFHFAPECPDWLRSAVTDPAAHPLNY